MKRNRPWDRKSKRKKHDVQVDRSQQNAAPSYVEIQGTKFFSDRFYLNEYDENCASSSSTTTIAAVDHHHPECRRCQHPPMFSRSALVASLSLKAAILATYNLEINAMVEELPSIFQKDSSIPCLVLHGTRGLTKDAEELQLMAPRRPDQNHEILKTEDDTVKDDDDDSVLGNHLNNVENCINGPTDARRLPLHVFFSEVKSTWLPQIPASLSAVVCNDTGYLRPEIIKQRQAKRGVHHPKFMILLEQTGSIVVVISTLNLTRGKRSIDGSWIQRFHPMEMDKRNHRVVGDSSVGTELARLLQYQTLATAPEQITAHAFVQRHMGWSSVFDLSTHYNYQQACVHLVATVPGDYTCSSFGQQRLSAVTRKLPFALVSEHDRLIIQPTSIGAEWKDDGVANLVRSYLNLETATYREALRRLDIVWPTAHFIRNAGKGRSSVDPTFSPKHKGSRSEKLKNSEEMKGFIFLSSATFNRIDVDCLSRMMMYEPCERQQRVVSPHFKSVARLYEGSDYGVRKEYGFPKCQELFSWFLLTSACLSKGAQGEREGDNTVAYANFELGVLFSSRHGGDRCGNNRIYCWKPQRCVCSTHSSIVEAELIHLPVPYCLRAPSYTGNCEDSAAFCETPFFHEITPETAACGNMQLTPYGKALCIQTTKGMS